jgi:phosphatidylserine/phosphatidylglycerophosphate/cardiolipin synthase-like enzyme
MPVSLNALRVHLRKEFPEYEEVMFGVRNENHISLNDTYLFDTPHGWWDHVSGTLPPPHSDRFPLIIRDVIAQANWLVDVVTMDVPTGRFLEAIINGCKSLDAQVMLRILIGAKPVGDHIDTKALAEHIRSSLPNQKPGNIYVGAIGVSMSSWNHAKFVAADGKYLITGGHNLIDAAYLSQWPIFDLSLRVDGPIAETAHSFADVLWNYVRAFNQHRTTSRTYSNHASGSTHMCKDAAPVDRPNPAQLDKEFGVARPSPGAIPVMYAVNPGLGTVDTKRSAGLEVMCEAIRNADSRVRISQQDLGAYAKWEFSQPEYALGGSFVGPGRGSAPARPSEFSRLDFGGSCQVITVNDAKGIPVYFSAALADALAGFLLRTKVEKALEIIVSNVEAPAHGTSDQYSNHVDPRLIGRLLLKLVVQRGKTPQQALNLLVERLFIGTICINAWANGKNNPKSYRDVWDTKAPMGNHAKFWMVDDHVFYVGSENAYPTIGMPSTWNLQAGHLHEYGVIVESQDVSRKVMIDQYFGLMRERARPVDITGMDAGIG